MANGQIVVTGASGALGSGVVRALAYSGQRVIAVDRDEQRARKLFEGLTNCRVLSFDISSAKAFCRKSSI